MTLGYRVSEPRLKRLLREELAARRAWGEDAPEAQARRRSVMRGPRVRGAGRLNWRLLGAKGGIGRRGAGGPTRRPSPHRRDRCRRAPRQPAKPTRPLAPPYSLYTVILKVESYNSQPAKPTTIAAQVITAAVRTRGRRTGAGAASFTSRDAMFIERSAQAFCGARGMYPAVLAIAAAGPCAAA